MPRVPGSGRRPGSRNKVTREFRHAVQLAFERIGGVDRLTAWADTNPDAFYKICGRLIPGEMAARTEQPEIRVIVDRTGELRRAQTFNAAPALLKSEGGERE